MRLMLLKISWLLAGLIAGGCMSPIPADVTGDVIVEPVPIEESVAGNAVSVSMTSEQFANLATWLGQKNSLVIEHAVHVEQESVTLDAKAGTRLSYVMADDNGTITFEKPYPTIKAGFAKLIGGVALRDIVLKSDGSGSAGTASFGRYEFRWLADDDSGSAATPSELPEVWAYSMPGCPPCVRARLELAAAKDLPFRVVWRDEAAPAWLATRPAFWWHTTGQQPTQADVANTRQTTGWNGVKDFTQRWKASRAVSSYHAGHNCPSCGRTQLAIANNDGPNHVHKCGSCNVTWWHADQ